MLLTKILSPYNSPRSEYFGHTFGVLYFLIIAMEWLLSIWATELVFTLLMLKEIFFFGWLLECLKILMAFSDSWCLKSSVFFLFPSPRKTSSPGIWMIRSCHGWIPVFMGYLGILWETTHIRSQADYIICDLRHSLCPGTAGGTELKIGLNIWNQRVSTPWDF